ncbi:MAG: DNA polymerase III subunit alpha [Clostridia bacterium]
MSFTHLHLHTEFSLLDGACRIDKVLQAAKDLGQTSIAITDHGVMYGVMDFYKKAKQVGIKPIIGCECYVAARTRHDKVHGYDNERFHLILLCKNMTGYKNLIKMVSQSWTEGFYTKPRIDHELLKENSEGLIAMSACLAGEIPRYLMRGDYEKAKSTALWYQEIFGEENYFLEIQNHYLKEELSIQSDLVKLSRETGIPLVATNDTHYIKKQDSKVQQVLICIQTNHVLGEDTGLEFSTDEFYLKSEDEMLELFSAIPEAVHNTQIVADKCNLDFEFGNTILPHFDVPNNMDHFVYFKNQCYYGLSQLFGEDIPQNYVDRLNYELDVINNMGYVDYFLIVHDFIRYAKTKNIPVGPGRGSGAGSLAAYSIGITGIDPMKYNLLFERFLNPERVSMPDFDIDFCYVRRQEVIDYVIDKYGSDHVAQIVTFGTMAAKAAIRDVGRALGVSYPVVDMTAKLIPNELKMTIDRALKMSKELQSQYDTNEEVKKLIDIAKEVEGMPRHASTHAAGVVITREQVHSYVPLAVNDESIVTQFTMTTLEELGLLKMDFLGLRTLTVIDDAVKYIKTYEPNFDIDQIPLDDKPTFDMLSLGHTDSVFQYESAGMRRVLSKLKPESLEDLIAVISLYRPGPADSIGTYINNRHNPEDTQYKTPMLKDILDVTYGCMVYQEQVMEIFRKLAGYSYGRSDLVRRAMSKKKVDVMEKERQNFIHGYTDETGKVHCVGAVSNGVSAEIANEIFDQMSNFAKYAFNKSHAAAYAYVSYQTAYLKCHYPCEMMAATLSSVLDSSVKVSMYIEECTRIGIKVIPPNVNTSFEGFTVSNGNINFGLLAIKNLGRGLIKTIVDTRQTGGDYTSFYSFCQRVHGKDFNKRAIESLIKAGGLDGLGLNRCQMLQMLPVIAADIDGERNRNIAGQIGFFDEGSDFAALNEIKVPNVKEFDYMQKLTFEKEMTGLYLSGHPMKEYTEVAKAINAAKINEILESENELNSKYKDNQKVTVFGIITKIEKKLTRKNANMCFVNIEDTTGVIECVVFSRQMAESAALLKVGGVIVVNGKINFKETKDTTIVCDNISANPKNIVKHNQNNSQKSTQTKKSRKGIFLRAKTKNDESIMKIYNIISNQVGNFPIYLFFEDTRVYEQSVSVKLDDKIVKKFEEILGKDNVVVRI